MHNARSGEGVCCSYPEEGWKCKITPKKKTTPKEEEEKKKSGRKVRDGVGVPGRVFQKPVKVFPSANTTFLRLYKREARRHTHTSNPKLLH